jgi:hypothetical protein
MAVMIHGTIEDGDRSCCDPTAVADCATFGDGLPQPWQYRAPGVSSAPQPSHLDDSKDAPQLEQNRPVPVAPQAAQTTVGVAGSVMGYNLLSVISGCIFMRGINTIRS